MQKYPRTLHLPWSPGISSDDKVLHNTNCFLNKNLVFTEKLDGENTTLYNNYIHARSIDSKDHESRHWIKSEWSKVSYLIPNGWRICGENMFAKHSIGYNKLKSYFYIIAIFDENNICLSWEDTKLWSEEFNFPVVPEIKQLFCKSENEIGVEDSFFHKGSQAGGESIEGFVVRNSWAFPITEWNQNIAKWVRKNHVQTSSHWLNEKIIPNKLSSFSST